MTEVVYQNGFGYVPEEDDMVPTNRQLELQDSIDNAIAVAVQSLMSCSRTALEGVIVPEYEHDIYKLTQIRELIQDLYNIPEAY